MTVEKIDRALQTIKANDPQNVLALHKDLPNGQDKFAQTRVASLVWSIVGGVGLELGVVREDAVGAWCRGLICELGLWIDL